MQTLRHRISEANQKIQQVRRYVYNRRTASPKARLRVWFTTVWATVVTGLPEVGMTQETACHLRGWYKLRSVLNQPANISHIPTADLFSLHKTQDPVRTLETRMQGRLKKLHKRAATRTDADPQDVVIQPHILIHLERILKETSSIPRPTPASHHEEHRCMHCATEFASEHGLRMHVAKMHRDTLIHFIPPDFRRDLHAKDGMPTCASATCSRVLKQWTGLRNHLLFGACPEPEKLRKLTVTSDLLQLQELKRQIQGSPRAHLGQAA